MTNKEIKSTIYELEAEKLLNEAKILNLTRDNEDIDKMLTVAKSNIQLFNALEG